VRQAVEAWIAAWQADRPPELTYWPTPGYLQIYDGRHPGAEGTYAFEGFLAEIYLACSDRPTTAAAVRDKLSHDVPVETVQRQSTSSPNAASCSSTSHTPSRWPSLPSPAADTSLARTSPARASPRSP
jgi:hypothetical protein